MEGIFRVLEQCLYSRVFIHLKRMKQDLKEMIAFSGLDCNECGAFLAIKERDGNLVSDRYFWIREPKTP